MATRAIQLIFRDAQAWRDSWARPADAPTENSVSDAGMRYDLTVPLARVFAEYRSKLPASSSAIRSNPSTARPAARDAYASSSNAMSTSSVQPARPSGGGYRAGAEVLQTGLPGTRGLRHPPQPSHDPAGLMESGRCAAHDLEGAALVAIDKLDKIGLEGVRKELLGARGVPAAAAESLLHQHGRRRRKM